MIHEGGSQAEFENEWSSLCSLSSARRMKAASKCNRKKEGNDHIPLGDRT